MQGASTSIYCGLASSDSSHTLKFEDQYLQSNHAAHKAPVTSMLDLPWLVFEIVTASHAWSLSFTLMPDLLDPGPPPCQKQP